MVIAAPFSNYASTTSNPATVRSPHFDSPLPPAKNFLSEAERTDLVRRSQKLQAYFGKPLEEDTAEKLLVRPGSFPSSPHEQPYAPSPLGAHDALFSGTSTVFLAEPLSPRTHDPLDDYSPVDSPPAWHSLSSSPPLLSSAQQLREERRRTIAKLERLLGERVTHIELDTTGSAGSNSSSMGRSSSRIGELIKGAGDKLKLHKRSSSEIQRDARDEQWVIVNEPMAPSSPSLLPPVGGSLEGLTKSRKMENVNLIILDRERADSCTGLWRGPSRIALPHQGNTSSLRREFDRLCRSGAPAPDSRIGQLVRHEPRLRGKSALQGLDRESALPRRARRDGFRARAGRGHARLCASTVVSKRPDVPPTYLDGV